MSQEKASVTRVLMIDDHALFRESVARVLAADPQLEIEHCGSIAAALPLLGQRTFDLVLLDHDLGGERASQFLPAARQGGFAGRVLVVTAWGSGTEARRLLQQGVAGIFLKQSPLDDLTAAIHAVMNGGNWIDKALAAREESPAGTESSAPQFNGRQRSDERHPRNHKLRGRGAARAVLEDLSCLRRRRVLPWEQPAERSC